MLFHLTRTHIPRDGRMFLTGNQGHTGSDELQPYSANPQQEILSPTCRLTHQQFLAMLAHRATLNSNRDRRRRLLAIHSATISQPEPVIHDANRSASASTTSSTVESAYDLVREYLRGSSPRTWLFVGDCLGFAPQMVRRSYIEYFSDMLRTRLNRAADAVVDITISDSSMLKLRDQMTSRLNRFRPDVVFCMPGLQDVVTATAGRESFEKALLDIADRADEHSCLLVLSTPPMLLAANREEFSDLPAYVDIIRDVAQTRELLLVDHWNYWTLARETSEVDEWVDGSCIRLLHEGHRRASQLLLRTLGVLTFKSTGTMSAR